MSNKEQSLLVGVQVEVNRAVWAMNIDNVKDKTKSTFGSEENRKKYIEICVDNAIKDLGDLKKRLCKDSGVVTVVSPGSVNP